MSKQAPDVYEESQSVQKSSDCTASLGKFLNSYYINIFLHLDWKIPFQKHKYFLNDKSEFQLRRMQDLAQVLIAILSSSDYSPMQMKKKLKTKQALFQG